jgi:uncharacterized protein
MHGTHNHRVIPALPISASLVAAFIVLVLALSWLRLLARFVDLPAFVADGVLLFLASFGPILVALLLVGLSGTGIRRWRWLRYRFAWRRGIRWYAIAVAGPVVVAIVGAVWLALSGRAMPDVDVATVVGAFGILVLAFVFSLGEEYGWRAYLQSALQIRMAAWIAALVVGLVWTVWHAPLFLMNEAVQSDIPIFPYLALLLGTSVAFAWLYNSTEGSVALVALCHASFNASIGSVFQSLPAADGGAFIIACAVLAWAVALAIIMQFGSYSLTARPRHPAPDAGPYQE